MDIKAQSISKSFKQMFTTIVYREYYPEEVSGSESHFQLIDFLVRHLSSDL